MTDKENQEPSGTGARYAFFHPAKVLLCPQCRAELPLTPVQVYSEGQAEKELLRMLSKHVDRSRQQEFDQGD